MEKGMFDVADYISRYTRSDALQNGFLIDLSPVAKEEGFLVPVAVTCEAYQKIRPHEESELSGQDLRGRLHDMFWMLRLHARQKRYADTDRLAFNFLLAENGVSKMVELVFVVHPGDQGEPVMTIMLPHED